MLGIRQALEHPAQRLLHALAARLAKLARGVAEAPEHPGTQDGGARASSRRPSSSRPPSRRPWASNISRCHQGRTLSVRSARTLRAQAWVSVGSWANQGMGLGSGVVAGRDAPGLKFQAGTRPRRPAGPVGAGAAAGQTGQEACHPGSSVCTRPQQIVPFTKHRPELDVRTTVLCASMRVFPASKTLR